MANITVTERSGALVVDSRLIAQELNVDHKNLIAAVRTYSKQVSELGAVAFEKSQSDGKGRPECFVYLNEDQAIFMATLSRNNPRVVQFKLDLVKAFSDAKRRLQQSKQEFGLFVEEAEELLNLSKAIDDVQVIMRRARAAVKRFDAKASRYHLTEVKAHLHALLCNLADEIAGTNLPLRQILKECHLTLENGVVSIDFPSRDTHNDLMTQNDLMMPFIYGCAGVDATSIDILIDGESEIQFDVQQAIGYDRWSKRQARREE